MVSESTQHPGEICHAGAAAAEFLRYTRGEDLVLLERGVILGDEVVRLVVLCGPSREAAAELVRYGPVHVPFNYFNQTGKRY